MQPPTYALRSTHFFVSSSFCEGSQVQVPITTFPPPTSSVIPDKNTVQRHYMENPRNKLTISFQLSAILSSIMKSLCLTLFAQDMNHEPGYPKQTMSATAQCYAMAIRLPSSHHTGTASPHFSHEGKWYTKLFRESPHSCNFD